jgi:ABC-type amino acid transport substrate-binding protein
MANMLKIQSDGTWRWGISTDMPPFAFRSSVDGSLMGLEIDLAKRLTAAVFGCTPVEAKGHIEFVEIPFADRVPAIVDGRVDSVIEIFAETEERKTHLTFAGCYMSGRPALIANAECEPVTSLKQLSQLKVAVLDGSTGGDIIEHKVKRANLLFLPTTSDCLRAVQSGQADAFWGSHAENFFHLDQSKGKLHEILMDSPAEPWKIAVRKDAEDMARFLNEQMETMITTGTLARLVRQWFRPTMI